MMNDEEFYVKLRDDYDPQGRGYPDVGFADALERGAEQLRALLKSGEVTRSPESDRDDPDYAGFDYVAEMQASAFRIRAEAARRK